MKLTLVCIADTHERHDYLEVPEGDVLIHAGDCSFTGTIPAIVAFNNWLGTLPHKHKIFIAGNHDWLFQTNPALAKSLLTNATYLQDSGVEIEGFKFWGSPVSPEFNSWAFNRKRGKEINKHWKMIPMDTDVLITHGPPHGVLDRTQRGQSVGCKNLENRAFIVQPQFHIFGHIHEGYGMRCANGTTYINASSVNASYIYANAPIIVDLEK